MRPSRLRAAGSAATPRSFAVPDRVHTRCVAPRATTRGHALGRPRGFRSTPSVPVPRRPSRRRVPVCRPPRAATALPPRRASPPRPPTAAPRAAPVAASPSRPAARRARGDRLGPAIERHGGQPDALTTTPQHSDVLGGRLRRQRAVSAMTPSRPLLTLSTTAISSGGVTGFSSPTPRPTRMRTVVVATATAAAIAASVPAATATCTNGTPSDSAATAVPTSSPGGSVTPMRTAPSGRCRRQARGTHRRRTFASPRGSLAAAPLRWRCAARRRRPRLRRRRAARR